MSVARAPDLELSAAVIEAIESFPLAREVTHCGRTFSVPSLDIYATCPQCGVRLKVRAMSALTEIEDLFDAFATWLAGPGASQAIQNRQRQIAED
jgi:predicted  nucleic acid-binding Zn-ribbon protein